MPSRTVKNMQDPAVAAVAITPHDTNKIPPTRSIYVGVGGDVTLLLVNDSAEVLFKSVPTGTILPVMAIRVKSTGTTATTMLALY